MAPPPHNRTLSLDGEASFAPAVDAEDATLVPHGWNNRASHTIRRTPAAAGGDDPLTAELLAPESLARLAVPLASELELLGRLGEGGMGVVRLARQVLLGREVAVKSVHPDAPHQRASRSLLQEAWAAAALEHPNVVPVYLLAADEQGQPHVVMRRIEGRTWGELIHNPEDVQASFGARDLLGWHLSVLMQVCNAVHFAHSRGVLHRDLKPDNVMVGAFGEVYVLDWGLAVRLREGGPARLGLARDEIYVVGTPRYMAPEMAAAEGHRLSERTDVYLLGGLLLTVLTGRGPHPGEEAAETLASIPFFEPALPPDVPRRLANVVRRAMATDPEQRFPSAEALRLEVQGFLEERSADGLAAEAAAELTVLEAALAADPPDRQQVYRHFEACRFGFRQALRAWPGHEDSSAGLRRALRAMIGYELDQGDARAASVHLADVADPPAELVARVAAAEAGRALAAADLARLRADIDPSLGGRTRIFVFSVVMLIWTLIPLGAWTVGYGITHEGLLLAHGAMIGVVVPLVVWARDSLGRTGLNRQVAQMLLIVQVALLIGDLAGLLIGMTAEQIVIFDQVLFVSVAALAAESQGRLARLPALGYLVALVVTIVRPGLIYPAIAACNLLVVVVTFAMWYPTQRGKLLRHPNKPPKRGKRG
ncbi:MAG: serine/threonine-protein kinase [Pseudomonadota bacterium]|nr:serine/threonine-protein kinase [Pseudomonadota bacterium]